MTIQPKEEKSQGLGYFKRGGTNKRQYALITETYYNRTDSAKAIIDSDPDQINRQDPHSGLTALHIAIFRQNQELVETLALHPDTNFQLKDNFGRLAADMLTYTKNQSIYDTVMGATFPDIWAELDECELDDDDPTPPSGGNVIDFGPKP